MQAAAGRRGGRQRVRRRRRRRRRHRGADESDPTAEGEDERSDKRGEVRFGRLPVGHRGCPEGAQEERAGGGVEEVLADRGGGFAGTRAERGQGRRHRAQLRDRLCR